MGGLRGQEILIIVILLILVFGWKKLPDAARSLGRSARVFKSEVEEMKKDGKDPAADATMPGETAEEHRPAQPQQQVAPPPAGGYQQQPQAQPQHQTYEQPQAQPQYEQPQPQQPYRNPGETPDDPTRPVA